MKPNHYVSDSADRTLIAKSIAESFFCSVNSLIALKC